MLRGGRFRLLFASTLLFSLLAPDALRAILSWWGYGAIVSILALVSVVVLYVERDRWAFRGLPIPLLAFLLLTTASIAWSHYPAMSVLGSATTWATVTGAVALAVAVPWDDLLRYLGYVLRAILGLSLVFELFVALVVRQPLLPLWYSPHPESETIPSFDYWSLANLFAGGKIQGIVGNSNLLGFIALLGVIVFGAQLVDRRVRLLAGWSSMVAAVAVVLLTRSATVLAGLVALGFLLLAVGLIRRAGTSHERANAYIVSGVVTSAALGVVILFHAPIFDALDKSSTLTGRVAIWEAVIGLASERPLIGWGWISHWAPWVDPLGSLAMIDGVFQLQAHNAWLDVWMQLGVLGLVVFGILVLATAVRTWLLAVDRRTLNAFAPARFDALTVVPLLMLAALVVQSLSESRILVEGGLLLFALIAVKTKRHELG